MNEILNYNLFTLGNQNFSIGQLILAVGLIGIIYLLYRMTLKKYFPKVFESTEVNAVETSKLGRIFRGLAILCLILAIVISFNLDYKLYTNESYSLSVLHILRALIFFQVARLFGWFISNLFIHNYYVRRDSNKENSNDEKPESESSAIRTVQYIFYTVVGIYILKNFQLDSTLYEKVIDGETVSFNLSNILVALLILFLARLIVWVITQLILYNIYKSNSIEIGSRYAVNQLIKYIVYIFAFITALDVFGINMNILLGGAAALLVGIGLGLQQTFNDFISGLVLLFERSVSVGDVLEINGEIGTVRKIGLRASTLETRGNVILVVPNHKLVNQTVINWNHENDKVRFNIDLGVAYGSDSDLVKKLLIQAAKKNPYVIDFPAPFVRFQNFGNSSLDFSLYFFSRNLRIIEDIKSDLRLEIDLLFRANNISIPFPQREIRIKSDDN